MKEPEIYVLAGKTAYGTIKYSKARIRKRAVGKGTYQYLVWRAYGKLNEYYLGPLPYKKIDRPEIKKSSD